LYFGERELYFQCRKEDGCECTGAGQASAYSNDRWGPDVRTLRSLGHSSDLDAGFGYLWSSVIEQYSRLKLTYESDRLSALSGLAKLSENFRPGRYIAGMWEKDIQYQLLWELPSHFGFGVYMGGDHLSGDDKQASVYAPSFSWTFWAQPILYSLPQNASPAYEVLELHSTIPGSNIYGQISDARRGLLTSIGTIYSRVSLVSTWPKMRHPEEYLNPLHLHLLLG
jgi:hypothetical protein